MQAAWTCLDSGVERPGRTISAIFGSNTVTHAQVCHQNPFYTWESHCAWDRSETSVTALVYVESPSEDSYVLKVPGYPNVING